MDGVWYVYAKTTDDRRLRSRDIQYALDAYKMRYRAVPLRARIHPKNSKVEKPLRAAGVTTIHDTGLLRSEVWLSPECQGF